MKEAIRAAFVALILAAPAFAQTPPAPPSPPPVANVVPQAVITAPASIPAGSPLVLMGDKSSAVTLTWKLVSPKGTFLVFDQGKRPAILAYVPNPTPGTTYRFALVATGTDAGSFDFDFADVAVQSDAPVPNPPPTPPPNPPPVPPAPPTPATLPSGFIVTLATDSRTLTAPVAAVRDSVSLPLSVQAMGGRWTTVDTQSAEYTRRNLGPVSGPTLFLQSSAGKVLDSVPAPADESGIVAYLKSKGGR